MNEDKLEELAEPARKIKGYRLKEECKQYHQALDLILDLRVISSLSIEIPKCTELFDSVQEAGVMHWFEPVYEQPDFTAKKGEWVVPIEFGCYGNRNNELTIGKAYELSTDLTPNFFAFVKDNNGNEFNISSYTIKLRKATPSEIQKAKEGETKVITMRCEGGTFEIEVSKKGIFYRGGCDACYLNEIEIKSSIRTRQVTNSRRGSFDFKPVTIDAGCKPSTFVSDWEKVIEEYERICKS